MAHNKEKLFKPEDFDKNISSGNDIGWKKPVGILSIVAALGGITYGAYSLFGNDTDTLAPNTWNGFKNTPTTKPEEWKYLSS